MNIFINRCFHWVSFHFIDQLLLQNYEVTGLREENNSLSDHLAMFFGRNSYFTEINKINKRKSYDIAFIFENEELINQIKAKKIFFITKQNKVVNKDVITIRLPLLFGEWMNMDEKGMYEAGNHIPFTSDKFKEEAIYIRPFIKLLQGWIEKTSLPKEVKLVTKHSEARKDEFSPNNICILIDNMHADVSKVISHYNSQKSFYEHWKQ